ncbi:MAG: GSCFA domain-containing protein, partial [Rhodobacterales bacterium]|nr:GSCFA domain-containing protein [Rhodobacterales bacterium]
MFDIAGLWQPKLPIYADDKIATFGSCFAQHFGRALVKKGYTWYSTEPSPPGLSSSSQQKFNYGVFSCRTGNIYTTSLLRQWVEWATGKTSPPDEYWEKDGRFYDPFRPAIEPDGFETREEMERSRQHTIQMFMEIIASSDVFVFTLGLTESWFNKQGKYEYPMCPGTVAGEFDPKKHIFKNQDTGFVKENLMKAIELIKEVNPKIRFL